MVENEYPLALVTGAVHRLGHAFARSLARQGYAILLHYHLSRDEAETAAIDLRSLGVPVYPFQADLTVPGQIHALFQFLDTLPHPVRILVNSAAVMPRADIRRMALDDWDNVLNLNLRAPFLLAQAAAERMLAGGLIVNLTDSGASKAWTGFPAYIVSKAGLESLTRVLARAYAPGIRVNAIAPGLVLPGNSLQAGQWEKLVERLPQKRPAAVEQVVMALDYLIRNEAVTGQIVVVDGGYSLI
jgi:NAD(P)-dependent dehydrogenase (short-subunit alcohol dehydrogenase family)